MKNLRISSKLIACFATLLMVLLVVGGLSIYNQNVLSNGTKDIAARLARLQKLTHIVDTQTSHLRAEEMTHIVTTAPEAMVTHEKTMRDAAASIDRSLATIGSMEQDPAARTAMADFTAARHRYAAHIPQTIAFSARNETEAAQASALREAGDYDAQRAALGRAEDAYSAAIDAAHGESQDLATAGRWITVAMILGTCALAVALLVLLIRQIANPLTTMTEAMGELAAGNMNVAVPDADRRDEVGMLAQAMARFRDQLAFAERAKTEQTALIVDSIGRGLSELAEGRLTTRVTDELTGPFAKLKADFNSAAEALQTTLAQVSAAVTGINGGAREIRIASDDLSQRTEQQAASLEETASAMEEITATMRANADRTASTNAVVRSARELAEQSGGIVREAVTAMGGIERRSNEISDIIGVIDGIAFQTNLLALNAGVEAARAGDAGKGFAVVASEVRALAQRSADAAKDVKERIGASTEQVAQGVRLVGETGTALTGIIERIVEISGLVGDIASAAEQQSAGLQQVNMAVNEMDGVTQQNAAMVEEATAAARSLASEADSLARQITRFDIGEAVTAPVLTSPAPASPVHALQDRVAASAPRIAAHAPRPAAPRPIATRSTGGAQSHRAPADDDWTEF
ncbi:methyl-accepting chemotaxis protein [Sphingomonadaceae bacterium jetA1]|jgi:methyl-accepting chemotaxis protein|uniref:HAMP domain-containing methyl-accepting chemotaxis protein n=1 Tax=Facivitalis istanbulensis TaxID=3075838 RepID=UPI003483CDE7